MELDWLETILAVVDRGGFTAASAHVHRSQSRVSAHIAALERELGVRLIDRSRRPASATPAGRLFAGHARQVLVEVSSARSAINSLSTLAGETLAILTIPCIGSALFPGVVAETVRRQPDARFTLSERGFRENEGADTAQEFALAVLPSLAHPHPAGYRERVLWTEPIRVLVPVDHELAAHDLAASPLTMQQLVRYPLVISGNWSTGGGALSTISAQGFDLQRRVGVDAPATLVDMVRRGLGVGVQNSVAIEQSDLSGLAVLDLDDPRLSLEVAAYWSDVLLATEIGRTLHGVVMEATPPPGAVPARSQPEP